MINSKKQINLKVEINKKDLKRIGYWSILKFKNDKNHFQKIGNKTLNIGCYLDGWIQKLPEKLILEKIVENKDYSIIEDNFIYGQDTKKNSPDLIGIKKGKKIIPLASYNNGNWEIKKNAPFVELKTFKPNQLLITIPKSQFNKNNYYVVVESNLKEDYLLHLFDESFFEECELDEFKIYDELIQSDDKLIKPLKIKKPKDIGSYELIGIYKGTQISKISKTVGKGSYYYLESYRKIKSKDTENTELKNGPYCHSVDEVDCFAFCIHKEKNSKIILKNKGKTYIDVQIIGTVQIDNFKLRNERYRLKFKKFTKESESLEVIVPRNTLITLFDSKHEELLEKLDEFVKNQS